MNLGTKIRIVRVTRGMRQTEFAKLVGVDQAYMSKFESGRMNPTEDELARIKQALDWDVTVARIKAELA